MTETAQRDHGRQEVPIPQDMIAALVARAARAPSVHNTQPWRFLASRGWLELHADHERNLPKTDPAGREMLISCGAALFGLRLAIREIGYLPSVRLLPDPARPGLLVAMAHRHTHRDAFSAEPIPAGLMTGLQRDAITEGATLIQVDEPARYRQLADLVADADRAQRADAEMQAEVRSWTRPGGSRARDGV